MIRVCFYNYANADKVSKDFIFTTRRRGGLSEQIIDVAQRFCSKIQFEK